MQTLQLPIVSQTHAISAQLGAPEFGRIVEKKLIARPLDEKSGLKFQLSQSVGTDATTVSICIESEREHQQISLQQSFLFDLPWTSYVIAPGVMYNGNRFLVSPQPYCPYIPMEGVSPDGPIMVADVPRLTSETGYRVELAANALTTPFIGIYDPANERGILVQLPIYGDWGVSGVTLTTLPGEPVTLTLTLPVQRLRSYRICDWIDADEPGMDLAPGQVIEASVKIIPVKAANIPAFISLLCRRSFEARDQTPLQSHKDLARKLRTAGDLVEAKFNAQHWVEPEGYYRNARMERHSPWPLQLGWAGGATTMRAMLQSPSAQSRERARRMATFLCRAAAPSGYLYGAWTGKEWKSYGLKRPGCISFYLVRRPLEAGRDLLFAIEHLQARGESIEPIWLETARNLLDAVVSTERRFGHLGYSVNPENGDVVWGDGTGGAFALEGLVRGARVFKEPRYLKTAERLAAFYHENSLMKGYTCGGVGDALMAVDSESNYGLLAGLVHLHQATRNPIHLQWAVEAAELFQTWVLLYDAQFPDGTPLQKLGLEPRGAVLANIQNQHGAPGIFVASGIELTTLAKETGDERWSILLREITAVIPQMVVYPGQEEIWGDEPVGAVTERLMTMDGLQPCGTSEPSDSFGFVTIIAANELSASSFR